MMSILFLLLLGLSTGITSTAEAQKLPEVKIAIFQPPSIGSFLMPLIREKRLDTKNGVKILFDVKPGKAVRADFASGLNKVDGGQGYLNTAQYRLKGLKSQMLFNLFDYYGAVLTADPSVKNVTDLAGRRLGAAQYTTNFMVFQFFAKRAGLELSKMDIQSSGTAGGVMSLLMAGRVDAAQLWEPALTQAELKAPGKFHRLEYDQDWKALTGHKTLPYVGLAAHEGWVRENRSIIPRLYATFKDTERFLTQHPDEAARIIAQGIKITEDVIQGVIKKNAMRVHVVWASELAEEIDGVFKGLREVGVLEQIPDSGTIYRP